MSTINYATKNFLLPLSDIFLGTKIARQLKFLEKSQWWNLQKLQDYQNERLRILIMQAYRNVPYYHRLFKSLNLTSDSIRQIDDLKKLPIITKNEIRRNYNDFIAVNVSKNKMIWNATSGSTGIPFEYIIDKNHLSSFRSMALRSWEIAGYNLGDKFATIGGSTLMSKEMTRLEKITYTVNRNLLLSSFNMNHKIVEDYCKRLLDFKPSFIRGYPSSISIIANYLIENNLEINLSAVQTTGETITHSQRKKIMDAFNCEVLDLCGCNDGGECLFECLEHAGYHIGCEQSIHEFVNEGGEPLLENEIGNIVLTNLWNYTMPLIRYDAGDLAVYTEDECPCGRGLPLVKSIVGRSVDQIILPDGNYLPGLTFSDIFEKAGIVEHILDYQIIQQKVDRFHINLVVKESYNDDVELKISNFFERHMGIPLNIDFILVNRIQSSNSSKRKWIISKVKK